MGALGGQQRTPCDLTPANFGHVVGLNLRRSRAIYRTCRMVGQNQGTRMTAHDSSRAATNNHSNQMNPNNSAYWTSRGSSRATATGPVQGGQLPAPVEEPSPAITETKK